MKLAAKIRTTGVLVLILMVLFPALTAHALPVYPGAGNNVGLCLGNPGIPECADVDCNNPAFSGDERCTSEAEVGTYTLGGLLRELRHTENLGSLILKVVNFSLPYLALACFLGFITAGFFYVTAFGEEEQITKAKKILLWSVVGVLVVMAAFTIVQFFTTGLLNSLQPIQ